MGIKIEGWTPERGKHILEHSKWFDRYFKSKSELKNITRPNKEDGWQYGWPMRGPIYSTYALAEDRPTLFQLIIDLESSGFGMVKNNIETWGREGESYQEIFDACFCEEIFIPIPSKIAWRKLELIQPYDGQECELSDTIGVVSTVARWQEWVSHPGGDSTQNAGPCFVDDTGFPSIEEPIWWRPYEGYPAIVPEPLDKAERLLSEIKQYPRTPEDVSPFPIEKIQKRIDDLNDDDYYSTI